MANVGVADDFTVPLSNSSSISSAAAAPGRHGESSATDTIREAPALLSGRATAYRFCSVPMLK